MPNKPKVTVLMAVYNSEKYLKQAISSILEQTFSDFEFIIINDGSTDNSMTIIQSYSDERIRFINNSLNRGVIKTVNDGIDLAQGEYIARMDSDDICLPERLEKQVGILDAMPEIAMVSANVVLINTENEEIGFWDSNINAKTGKYIYRLLPKDNCIANPTVLIRSSTLKKYRYNENQKSSEDWDLWLRMASAGEKFFKLNETLVKYRIHDHSITVKFNKGGVYKIKAGVQMRFFIYELNHLRFNGFNLKVFCNAIANYLKQLLVGVSPNAIGALQKVATTNIFTLFSHLLNLIKFRWSKRADNTSLFFFFPFYHIGGAEKVHAQILSSVADKKPIVFITGTSPGKGFYNDFKEHADIVEMGAIADYPLLNKLAKKIVSSKINRTPDPVTFGCNSQFYYRLIPQLKVDTKCVDLIHAFVNHTESGPEYWSLTVVERLANRVVINQKTTMDFKKLYEENNVDSKLLSRIEYISNFVEVPEINNKQGHEKLNCIYVGRSSPEKRVYLIGEIAHEVIDEKIDSEFILVGEMNNALYEKDKAYCKQVGEIIDQTEIQKIYNKADILLLTSSREGFPMVIMEAMANGVVVISTDVGGIAERITNGENGILIEATSESKIIDEFSKAINVLSQNRDKLKLLSASAYSYAKANFNKEQFNKSYRKLLVA